MPTVYGDSLIWLSELITIFIQNQTLTTLYIVCNDIHGLDTQQAFQEPGWVTQHAVLSIHVISTTVCNVYVESGHDIYAQVCYIEYTPHYSALSMFMKWIQLRGNRSFS